MTTVCGTGEWGGPKPGDPGNNALLSATPAFGGVDVTWTYPTINPYAVSYATLYRNTISNFESSIEIARVAGTLYYDKTTTTVPVNYFYWIRITSVNGTVGELIGPATASARPTIEQTIEMLSGRINNGMLATELKTEINGIGLLGNSIATEVSDRIAANLAMGGAVSDMQGQVTGALTIINTEITERKDANNAMASAVNLVAAGLGNSIAGVAEEFSAFVSPEGAFGSYKTTTEATLNGDVATGSVGLTSTVESHAGQLNTLNSAYVAKVQANGLVGGFGLVNDGASVEAGFDVDTFWVGRSNTKIKPFIISGNEVFINQAVINQLTFSKLRADDGSVIVENGKLKATHIDTSNIFITSGGTSSRMEITNNSITVYDGNGKVRVKIGNLV
jgi:hypothetical protein